MRNKSMFNSVYGIQKQIILLEAIIFSILLFVTYVGVYYIIKIDRYEALSKQYSYVNERLLQAFENMNEDAEQLTEEFILNEYVQKAMTNQEFTASDLEMMKSGLVFLNNSFLDYYLVIDNKGNLYSQREVDINLATFRNSFIYKSLGTEYSKAKLIWARDTVFGTNEMSFFVVRYIHEMNSPHAPGVLILKLNDSVLQKVIENITDEELCYFILDSNDEVCFGQMSGKQEWNPERERDRKILWNEIMGDTKGERKYRSSGIVSIMYENSSEFAIITYAPKEVTNAVFRRMQSMLAVIFIAIYILGIAGINIFTKRLTRPIKYVSDVMSDFDANRMDERIDLRTNTELDQIGHAYNKMVETVVVLMDDVKKKEQELRKSEQESLMYQIRPHFLYNTLDTIYMLARISKEETIMKMIQELSRFLRINLSNGNEEISVEKELEHVASYLEIQKIRNAELFTYEMKMDEAVAQLPVMKMILQPIAENCIKYGFRDIYEGGKIWICAYEENGYLCFSIANNGSSIEEEQLLKLNCLETMSMKKIDESIKIKQGGYGVSNVVKRLRLQYEDKIHFYYANLQEGGCKCVIEIKHAQL